MKLWPSSWSLKRRLTWRLIFLQTATLSIFSTAIAISLLQLDAGGRIIDARIVTTITAALERTENGVLVVTSTPDMRQLRQTEPDLWFVVVDEKGQRVAQGQVPEVFVPMTQSLTKIDFADIRDGQEPYALSAIVRMTPSKVGMVRVMTGRGPLVGIAYAIFVVSNLLVLPLLLVLAVVTLIAIPLIVTKAFAGISLAAEHARQIDIEKRGTRLPDDDVPAEVRPLVKAVNDALLRLDDGYDRHKRFLADAAHELKTPIAILQTRLEMLPDGIEKAKLMTDVARLGSLAEQLLDLQRLDQTPAVYQPVDLVAMAERVVADLAPLAIANNYELSFDAERRQEMVLGDAPSLERVMTNLVQNAIAHGGNGGAISVDVERGGIFEVCDQGPGVPEAERERIFEPFYRVRPSERGSGLGLNLVRDIVRRHNGHVSVSQTATGHGACFRVELVPADIRAGGA